MPFDGTDFQPGPIPSKRTTSGDNLVSIMIVAIALALLLTPFSLAGLEDIVAYVRRE